MGAGAQLTRDSRSESTPSRASCSGCRASAVGQYQTAAANVVGWRYATTRSWSTRRPRVPKFLPDGRTRQSTAQKSRGHNQIGDLAPVPVSP
jgi:hypothetical protein